MRKMILMMAVLGNFYDAPSQQILNGSFELNDLECGINLVNEAFNAHVEFITAFGRQSEIDLFSDSCEYGEAVHEDFFVALYNNTFSDAFAFHLSRPLDAQKLYRLKFAARMGLGTKSFNSRVQIGISNSPEAFGDLVFSSRFIDTTWTYHEAQFVSPVLNQFLNVRIVSPDETWIFLDDFSLDCPLIDLGPDTAYCNIDHIILSAPVYFEEYTWNTLSTQSSIMVQEPGVYWVEAKDGQCTIRDSVVISELPYNCDCPLFIPNVFSPNGDGVNDDFIAQSACEFEEYHLRIFNRWGETVFVSSDPSESWNNVGRKNLDSGVYIYQLTFSFYYHDTPVRTSGNITVLL